MTATTARLLARQEILDAMYWYTRAIDRLDKPAMARVFHPHAQLHYPFFDGPWAEVVDLLWPNFEGYDGHSLQMSQAMIDIAADGATATAESYVTATFWQAGDSEVDRFIPDHQKDAKERTVTRGTYSIASARYQDRWSLQDGRWALDDRRAVVDFHLSGEANGWLGDGRRDLQDPSYQQPVFA